MKFKIICFALCVFMSGCSSKNKNQDVASDDISSEPKVVYSSDYGTTYSHNVIPFTISYKESEIEYTETQLYTEESEHGYYVYVVVSVNISSLSEDDLYWIDKDEELKFAVLINNKANEIESTHMNELCSVDIEGVRNIVFELSNEYRYNFDESELTTFIDIVNNGKTDTHMYSSNIDKSYKTTSMNTKIYNAISEKYNQLIDLYKNYTPLQ